MKQIVSVNLTTRTATDWQPPVLTFGETLTLGLRFFKTVEGNDVETQLAVDSFAASIGEVDARPEGGKFALKIGNAPLSGANTTATLDPTATAKDVRMALEGCTAVGVYGAPRVVATDGSWLLFFGDGAQRVPLEVVNNSLWPISFGRVSAWQVDGKWVHELRLIQSPVAFASGHDVVLPPAPTITRIQAGGADASATFFWNEIQELYIPPTFRGSFIIKRGFAKSTPLGGLTEEDVDTIKAALQPLGANCFKVTLPVSARPAIEFIGDYAGQEQDLLTVEVKQAPPGDVTFTLDLDRAELGALLRRETAVTLPLQIRIIGTDDSGTEGKVFALTLPIVIQRPVIWDALEERPTIDWLRPFSPKTYVPFGANNVLTGNKFYSAAVGNGATTIFAITHGLGTEMVQVFARENVSGGRMLVHGTDFTARVQSANEVTVTALGTAPAASAWIITVVGAQTIAEWANGLTVTVPQVVAGGGYPSLPAFMDNIGERVQTLEDLVVPSAPAAPADKTLIGLVTVIPEVQEMLAWRGTRESMLEAFKDGVLDPALLDPKRAPYMLPAVHRAASIGALPAPLPTPAAGSIWTAGARTLIPGGGGVPSSYVDSGGFVASDGRSLYVARRDGTTTSYYPVAFERTLWAMAINDQMLAVNRTLEILWGVQAQLVHATCNAQWVLSVELGTLATDTTPATPGLNLQGVDWQTPVFSQAIVLSPLAQSHFFGVRILRQVAAIKLDQQRYGAWSPNNAAAPAGANFAIRARLARFDTENVDAPRGYVAWKLIGSIEIDTEGKETTKPAQARIY